MSASIYERKSHLIFKVFAEYGLSCGKSREGCASNNLSRDNENLLLVVAFYTPISYFWEDPILVKVINLL